MSTNSELTVEQQAWQDVIDSYSDEVIAKAKAMSRPLDEIPANVLDKLLQRIHLSNENS